jgi:galactose-1-phosphate uridylyltransferase
MTEFNCDEHPHGQIWASSFVPNEIAAQERVMVGYGMLAEAQRDLRAEQAPARLRELPAKQKPSSRTSR